MAYSYTAKSSSSDTLQTLIGHLLNSDLNNEILECNIGALLAFEKDDWHLNQYRFDCYMPDGYMIEISYSHKKTPHVLIELNLFDKEIDRYRLDPNASYDLRVAFHGGVADVSWGDFEFVYTTDNKTTSFETEVARAYKIYSEYANV